MNFVWLYFTFPWKLSSRHYFQLRKEGRELSEATKTTGDGGRTCPPAPLFPSQCPLGYPPTTEVSGTERGDARSVLPNQVSSEDWCVHHGSFWCPRLALRSLGHCALIRMTLHPRAWELRVSALGWSITRSPCLSVESAGVRGLRVLLPGAWERTLPSVSCPVLWGPCLRQLGHGVGWNQGSDEVLRPWFHQVRSLGQGFSNLAPQTLWDG